MAALIAPLAPVPAALSIFSGAGVLTAVQEILIGVSIGMVMQLAFEALTFAGQTISMTMGLGFATLIDPQRGASVPVLGQMFMIMGTLTYLAINGHLMLLGALANSFQTLPIGGANIDRNFLLSVATWGARIFETGILVALPVVIALVIVNLALGVVTRAAPQLNLFGIGFTITLLCGFFVLMVGPRRRHGRHLESARQRFDGGRRPGRRACGGSALMAESEQGGERTEEPSQRRLQQARERGQIPRSRELTNFATMIGGSATLIAASGAVVGHVSHIMRTSLSIDPQKLSDPQSMTAALGDAVISGLLALLPVFGTVIALVLLAAVALGGWNFSPAAMTPDFTRLSPFAGLQRLFGLRGVTELGKALLKCIVVGAVCCGIVSWLFKDVMALGHMAPRAAIGRGASLTEWAFVWLCASLALVAAIDVPLQLFQFKRSLRMTRQELRDEAKESDGRPETKQRIRRMQQLLARRRMIRQGAGGQRDKADRGVEGLIISAVIASAAKQSRAEKEVSIASSSSAPRNDDSYSSPTPANCCCDSGENTQRSGLRSISGVSSRQSSPRTSTTLPSMATNRTVDVPRGLGRTGERSENVPRVFSS